MMRSAAHFPRGHASSSAAVGLDWDPLYFFLIAVGYKVPWTAISSLLHQFNQQFSQPKVLLWLNLAYSLPSLPALLLHSSLQDRLESRLGVPQAALTRFVLGLGALVVCCLAFPWCSNSLPALLAATAAVGIFYSVAFGTSHQLVPRFNQRCTAALTTGFVSCGVVVLLADLALKPHSAHYTPAALTRLFEVAAAQTLVGLLAAVLLLRKHWRRLQAAGRQQQHQVIGVLPPPTITRAGSGCSSSSSRQLLLPRPGWGVGHVAGAVGYRHAHHHQQHTAAAIAGASEAAGVHAAGYALYSHGHQQCSSHSSYGATASPLSVHVTVSSDDGSDGSSHTHPSGRPSAWEPAAKAGRAAGSSSSGSGRGLWVRLQPLVVLVQLAVRIWPAWLALMMSVGSSMLLFPLFTCVDRSGQLGEHLPQVLFYSRLMGDILGRMVPPSWQLRSSRSVLAAAFFKTKLLLVLVPAILQPTLVGGDLPLAALVAANWFLSGYINTGAYLLAPRLAALEEAGLTGSWGLGWWGSRRKARLAGGKLHGAGSSGSEGRGGGGALARLGSGALKSKAGAVMSMCFQVACFMGLMGAWAVQEALHSSGHQAFAAAAAASEAADAAATATDAGLDGADAADAAAAADEVLGVPVAAPGAGVGLQGSQEVAVELPAGRTALSSAAAAAGDALSAAAAAIAASAAVASGKPAL